MIGFVSNKKVSTSMRKITRISLALGASAALVGLAALPASAADEDENIPPFSTGASIVVDGGALSMTVASALTPATGLIPGNEAVFEVSDVTVTDDRAVEGTWNVSVSMTNFTTDVQNAQPIPAAGSKYKVTEGTLSKVGTTGELVPTNSEWTSESQELPAVSAPGVYGNNTAGWQATLTVPVPSDTLAGTYSATLTHSII